MNRIIAASPYGNDTDPELRRVWVQFDDGLTLVTDLQKLLENDLNFSPLLEPSQFYRMSVAPDGLSVRWGAGVSLDAGALRLPDNHPDKPLETLVLSPSWRPLELNIEFEQPLQHEVLAELLSGGMTYARENYGVRNDWYASTLFDLYELATCPAWKGRQWEFLERVALPVLKSVSRQGRIPVDEGAEVTYLCSLCVGYAGGHWERVPDIQVDAPSPDFLTEQAVGYLKRDAVESLEMRLKRQGVSYTFIAFEGYKYVPELRPTSSAFG